MEIELKVYLKSMGYDDDDDIKYMVEKLLPFVKANIGWKDERIDKRFIVKFYDIFDGTFNHDDDTMNQLFDEFCQDAYEWVEEEMAMKGCVENRLTTSYYVGHYRGLILTQANVDSIREDNLYDVITTVYDHFDYSSVDRLREHIDTVNILQELENTYKDWWGEFVLGYKEANGL